MNITSGSQDRQSSLFRHEAIAAQRNAWLGHPRLIQPVSVALSTSVAIAATALIVGVLVWGQYTRRVRVYGSVVPSAGVIHVFAPQTGRVFSSLPSSGDTAVKAGEALFTITTDTTSGAGETELLVREQLQKQIDGLLQSVDQRRQLDRVEKQELIDRHQSVTDEIERVEAQIAQTEAYIAVLQPRVDKYRTLVAKGITLEHNYEVAEQNYMQNRQELESLRRQRVQLKGSATDIESRLKGFDASATIALDEMQQRIAALKEQLAQSQARHAVIVTAPTDGSVAATLAHSGQMVAAGTPLMSILPPGQNMEIHLLADSKAIGFIREGVPVLLRYTAFPYQKFGQYGGRITRVSRVTMEKTENESDAFAAQPSPAQARYRITVQPDQPQVMAYGKAEPLRAGMSVEADLLLDTRPLYQWFLEPVYSLYGRSSAQKTKLLP